MEENLIINYALLCQQIGLKKEQIFSLLISYAEALNQEKEPPLSPARVKSLAVENALKVLNKLRVGPNASDWRA